VKIIEEGRARKVTATENDAAYDALRVLIECMEQTPPLSTAEVAVLAKTQNAVFARCSKPVKLGIKRLRDFLFCLSMRMHFEII
jgi:hypothetical protein